MSGERFETKSPNLRSYLPAHEESPAINANSWDSVEMLELIAAIDSDYGTEIVAKDILLCTTFGELRLRVENHPE